MSNKANQKKAVSKSKGASVSRPAFSGRQRAVNRMSGMAKEWDGPFIQGVALSVADSDAVNTVFLGRTLEDLDRSYSHSNSLLINVANDSLAGTLTVWNYGLSDAELVSLKIVICCLDGEGKRGVGVYHHRELSRVLAAAESPTYVQFQIEFDDVTLTDNGRLDTVCRLTPSTITHVFAIVSDLLLDRPDDASHQLLGDATSGVFDGRVSARHSRKVACWCPQYPFALGEDGLSLTYSGRGWFDVCLESRDAARNADFRMKLPVDHILIGDLLNARIGWMNVGTCQIDAGNVVLSLNSNEGFLHTDGHAQLEMLESSSDGRQGWGIRLAWEDGSDGDFNDYIVRVFHR